VTSDRLVAAEVVLADGRVVVCDEDRDSDLFWAQVGAVDLASAIPEPDDQTVPPQLVARSEFFRRPLPTDAIATLVAHLAATHVRFGSAGRGNGCFERTTPCPGPILTYPFRQVSRTRALHTCPGQRGSSSDGRCWPGPARRVGLRRRRVGGPRRCRPTCGRGGSAVLG
jgi:hypothetical protein